MSANNQFPRFTLTDDVPAVLAKEPAEGNSVDSYRERIREIERGMLRKIMETQKRTGKESKPVYIHIKDDENMRAIMEKIRNEKLTDESTIRAIVDGYKFSSPEARQHTADRMIDLLKMGAFNQDPLPTITIKLKT